MPGIYESYAPIYRRIGQGAWSEWMARWTLGWLAARGIGAGDVVDWGCGDGAAALVFAHAGWRVTGIDFSAAMLALARQRSTAITWRHGDLRSTRLDQPAQLATAFYDTLNYMASLDDLEASWRTLANTIESGGYVVADMNTPHEYETIWDGRYVITADTEHALVINRLRYAPGSRLARGRVVWFVREADRNEWRRGAELHIQRAHTDAEIVASITQAGLTLVERRTPQGDAPSETATRSVYIARKR